MRNIINAGDESTQLGASPFSILLGVTSVAVIDNKSGVVGGC